MLTFFFRCLGFNIESLSVSTTDVSDLSRMTIVLQCAENQMNNAKRQLEDIVNVWAVIELGVCSFMK